MHRWIDRSRVANAQIKIDSFLTKVDTYKHTNGK